MREIQNLPVAERIEIAQNRNQTFNFVNKKF